MACFLSVHDQVASLHKLLITDVAGERPFPGVDPFVLHKIAALEESLGAVPALILSVTLVDLLVPAERLLVQKSGVALLANERQVVAVGSQMLGQLVLQGKHCGTQVAVVVRIAVVRLHVLPEQSPVGEDLVAPDAPVLLFVHVLGLMFNQVFLVRKCCTAIAAPERQLIDVRDGVLKQV